MNNNMNNNKNRYVSSLCDIDEEIYESINSEYVRQRDHVELIASENFVSKAVLEACGSVLTNKYAEGYIGKRFYSGCEYVDECEQIAIERVKKLFNANYANVQPHSGSQANQGAFLALLKPGDKVMGMSLDGGGHLTHGARPNLSGKWFEIIPYSVSKENYRIDYNEVEAIALKHKPKLIIAGFSCYSREIDFAKFREIADKVGAFLMADIAHIAGIIAAGFHQNPMDYAHVVTSTTHKTLRGPRGGLIMTNHEDIAKKIDSAIFPGLQGGPLMHIIAAKAVAFKEALSDAYKIYIKQLLANAKILASSLKNRGYDILTEGTDNHIVIVDLRKNSITGKDAANSLHRANITCNKNSIAFDDMSPFITSGIRLGSPAATSRGFKETEFELVANLIADVLDGLKINAQNNQKVENIVKDKILKLNKSFPLYDSGI